MMAEIDGFKIGDVKDSNVMVGHCNGAFSAARRLADPVPACSGIGILDRALRETPWYYEFDLAFKQVEEYVLASMRKEQVSLQKDREFLKERLLDERFLKESIGLTERKLRALTAFDWSKLESKDVDVQFGNRTFVDVHQVVDLKIFVNIGGKAGWVNFQQRVKMPKDAILDKGKWGISNGVLTITLPKEGNRAKPFNEGEGKCKRRAPEVVKEGGIHEDSCRRRR